MIILNLILQKFTFLRAERYVSRLLPSVHYPRHHVLSLDQFAPVCVPLSQPLPVEPLQPHYDPLVLLIPLNDQGYPVFVVKISSSICLRRFFGFLDNRRSESVSVSDIGALNGTNCFFLGHCDKKTRGKQMDTLLPRHKLPKTFNNERLR